MYKPLRNRVHKYCFLKCYHSIMLGNIKTFTNQISFFFKKSSAYQKYS